MKKGDIGGEVAFGRGWAIKRRMEAAVRERMLRDEGNDRKAEAGR